MTKFIQTLQTSIALLGVALVTVFMTACGSAATPTPTPLPPTPTPEPTARPEIVALGKATFIRVGCVACHAIKDISDQAVSAPRLDQAYQLAIDVLKSPEYKKSGAKATTPHEFFKESILEPDAYTYPTCPQGPCIKGTMPQNYKDILHPDELDVILTYLMSLRR